jgi:hypothetical protein
MIKNWINPFISFRSRLLIFVTIIVLTTIAAIYLISRHLEQRIAGLVEEHIKADCGAKGSWRRDCNAPNAPRSRAASPPE